MLIAKCVPSSNSINSKKCLISSINFFFLHGTIGLKIIVRHTRQLTSKSDSRIFFSPYNAHFKSHLKQARWSTRTRHFVWPGWSLLRSFFKNRKASGWQQCGVILLFLKKKKKTKKWTSSECQRPRLTLAASFTLRRKLILSFSSRHFFFFFLFLLLYSFWKPFLLVRFACAVCALCFSSVCVMSLPFVSFICLDSKRLQIPTIYSDEWWLNCLDMCVCLSDCVSYIVINLDDACRIVFFWWLWKITALARVSNWKWLNNGPDYATSLYKMLG